MPPTKRTLTVGVSCSSSALVRAPVPVPAAGVRQRQRRWWQRHPERGHREQRPDEGHGKLKTEYEKANPGVTVNFQVMEEGDLQRGDR